MGAQQLHKTSITHPSFYTRLKAITMFLVFLFFFAKTENSMIKLPVLSERIMGFFKFELGNDAWASYIGWIAHYSNLIYHVGYFETLIPRTLIQSAYIVFYEPMSRN